MQLSDRQITNFLFAVEGVGILFVGIFLVAYLGGLPTTVVLHSESAFRIPLMVLGALLLVLVLVAIVLAVLLKKK